MVCLLLDGLARLLGSALLKDIQCSMWHVCCLTELCQPSLVQKKAEPKTDSFIVRCMPRHDRRTRVCMNIMNVKHKMDKKF